MTSTVNALSGPSSGGGGGSSLISSWGQPQTIGALQAGSSVLSGLSTMGADQSRASSYQIQGSEWRTQAGDEQVMGQNQVTGLKNQYLSAIGGSTARMAAGGLDVGQGVGQQQRTIIGQNEVGTGQVDMLASDIRAGRDNINALQAQEAASQANAAGTLGLVGGILGGGLKLLTAGIL